MASVLSAPRFHNEEAAFAHIEALLWPNGPVCPHCGNVDAARIGRLQGKTSRAGMRKCYACRQTFTVRIGTIFEDSHAPMRTWLQAIHLVCSSKKGISTRQLQRTLGVGMKTAWHMGHRIRAAMAPLPSSGPIGGEGKYQYWRGWIAGPWLKVPLNYMFGRLDPSGWFIPYIGETGDGSTRFSPHERWAEAVRKYGATHVLSHLSSPEEAVRQREERDLILSHNPPMNTQRRPALSQVRPRGFGAAPSPAQSALVQALLRRKI